MKMRIVLVVFMMMIVSIQGETREECYDRCSKDCAITRRCDDKPAAPVASSPPSSSSPATPRCDPIDACYDVGMKS